MSPLLDVFDFSTDRRSPLKKFKTKQEFLDECLSFSQFSYCSAQDAEDVLATKSVAQETESDEEEDSFLHAQMKHAAEIFKDMNVEGEDGKKLDEVVAKSISKGDLVPLVVPNTTDKHIHSHAKKHNDAILRNRELLKSFNELCHLSSMSKIKDKASHCLSILDDVETGSTSD